jgi:hypothetical protein
MNLKTFMTSLKKAIGLALLLSFIASCTSKKIAEDPIKKYLSLENPYLEIYKSKAGTYGFGDASGALQDSILLCYELLEKNDENLKPIIHSLVSNNPEQEELIFIQGKNHMNQENYARAIEIFANLRSSENYDIKDQSRYYYALLSLYLNEKDQEALAIFNDISSDDKSEFKYHAKDIISYL